MKILKTAKFLDKKAYGNYPADVTNEVIDKQFAPAQEPSTFSKEEGEYETKIDWTSLIPELVRLGYSVDGLPQRGIGDIKISYTYGGEATAEASTSNNLIVSEVYIFDGEAYRPLIVSDPSIKEGIFDQFQDDIITSTQENIGEMQLGEQNTGPDTRDEFDGLV